MILGNVDVSALALKVGVDRTVFYRLSTQRNLPFYRVLKIFKALNLNTVVVDHPKTGSTQSLICEKLNDALKTDEIQRMLGALSEIIRAQKNVSLFAEKENLS